MLTKKNYFSAIVLSLTIFIEVAFKLYATGDVEDFFQYVDPNKTAGTIAVVFGNTNDSIKSKVIDVMIWDHNDFIAERGIPINDDIYSVTNIIEAGGRWKGTNWQYNRKNLTFFTKLTRNQINVAESSGGKSIAEFTFYKILGRGIDLSEFKQIEHHGNIFNGITQRRIPIIGNVVPGEEENKYICSYKLFSTELSYQSTVKLQKFPDGGFIPTRLVTYRIYRGITNLCDDCHIIAITNKPVKTSLNPLTLYKNAKILEQIGEKIFDVKNGNKTQIMSGTQPTFLKSNILLFIALFLFITIITAILWIFLKSRGRT